MSKDGINTKDFLIGALVGGIVGACTTLFLTPKSGKELRSDINEQAVIVKDKTGQIKNTVMEKGSSIAGSAKDKTAGFRKTVAQQSSNIVTKMKEMKRNGDSDIPTTITTEKEEPTLAKQKNEYITIGQNDIDIQKKLQETEKAIEDMESSIQLSNK
ncbi:YtxH domain-containing protein [Bacillus sp. SM2101]|uniref:YtxH domain-containing protein n=1 Tax=Bacillus sp. SM2101 TaxID=2805366 RepID=UPI001BDDF02D|nr:YtxH domain-containing protein [Bacillus sp. SM2101]